MDIKVEVKIVSPEIVAALLAFADALPQIQLGTILPASKELKETESKAKDDETINQENKKITIEDVRAKLAALSQSGKQPQVKALIKRFGANKLTDLAEDCYAEILKEAQVL